MLLFLLLNLCLCLEIFKLTCRIIQLCPQFLENQIPYPNQGGNIMPNNLLLPPTPSVIFIHVAVPVVSPSIFNECNTIRNNQIWEKLLKMPYTTVYSIGFAPCCISCCFQQGFCGMPTNGNWVMKVYNGVIKISLFSLTTKS